MFMFKKHKHSLLPVADESQDSDEASERGHMLNHEYSETKVLPRSRRIWSSNIPWICSTIGLLIYIFLVGPSPRQKTCEAWGSMDVAYARPLIVEELKTFTIGLDYNNENHTLQHTPAEGLRFVGPPSPELDAAWDGIAGTQETFLTKEEAIISSVEDTYVSPLTGLPVVEIESFHHLHCLNYIRKSIDIEHYPDISGQDTWRIHVEHCINSIREYLMCKADMTPIRLVPPEEAGVPVPVPEFRTRHVCRNFDNINHWVRKERTANLPEKESLEIAKRIREQTGTQF